MSNPEPVPAMVLGPQADQAEFMRPDERTRFQEGTNTPGIPLFRVVKGPHSPARASPPEAGRAKGRRSRFRLFRRG